MKVNERTGEFSLDLHEASDIKRAHQMQEGTRRIDVERGHEMRSRLKQEKVVHKDGRVVEVPEDSVESIKHKVRPLGRGGLSASEHFSMSDSYGKYEKGPDVLWFVWNDGWEATSLFSKNPASPQRDPYGNVWIKVSGEWALESEVE